MAGTVTTKFRLFNAEQLFEAFSESAPTNIYMFIAKSTPWEDDDNPPQSSDTIRQSNYEQWNETLALKKVANSDVTYAISRNDWTANTIYAQYEDDNSSFHSNNYYTMTTDYKVYKCLFNNDQVVSDTAPSGTANTPVTTSDGYIWKYMFTVPESDRTKFLTTNFIPVKTLTADDSTDQWGIQQSASNGAINITNVVFGGSGYSGHTGILQTANLTTAIIESTGSAVNDKYNGSVIYINGGTGAGQKREITDYIGSTKIVVCNSDWVTTPDNSSTYTISPKVVFVGDGVGAEGYLELSSNSISKAIMLNSGQNYSWANANVSSVMGSGANLHPQISPLGGHGSNPVDELAGHNIMLNIQWDGSESSLVTVNNDFRTIGLISNPLLASNNSLATDSVYDQTTQLTISNPSGLFISDELITGNTSGASGVMVDYIAPKMRLTEVSGTFTNAEFVSGNSSSTTATVNATPILGAIKKHSGKTIYFEHRTKIERNEVQIESLSTIIKF